jgi:HD superfamily phosphodiesterase
MLPTRNEAERLLEESHAMNPGPWRDHCRNVAGCAEIIARYARLNPDKAYVLGLLHDIGRRFGNTQMAHVTDGYHFLMDKGYDEAARTCVTHSFADRNVDSYIGPKDVSEADFTLIQRMVASEYDDYDRLVQLCDSLAMADGTIDLKARMDDIEVRHGFYPQAKRQAHYRLKEYFDGLAGVDLYTVLRAGG